MRGFVLAGIVFAAAAAYACDSFEESDVQPSADAGDDRAPVDPSDASDAGADRGATCEGEPEWVTTASAETTRTCGGGSVDLLTDANHCGRCNHSCGAEPCVAGTCAERKEDGDAAILAAVHAGAVYYVRRPGGSFSATPHELRRLVPGSAPVLLASLAADAGDAGGETKMLSASPSGDVVYVRTGKTIRRASSGSTTEVWKRARCGGAAVRIAKHPFTYRIALLGDRLYLGAEDGLFSIAK